MGKKQVLVFIEDGSFSFDNRVKREVSALIENGWKVRVVCPKYKEDKLVKRYSDKLKVYHYYKPAMSSAIGHIFEHLITLFWGAIYLAWIFPGFRFRVFHACNPTDILWILYLPFKLFGVKFIFDQHDLSPEVYLSRPNTTTNDFLYKTLKWLEKKSYKNANSVIATNETYKSVAKDRGRKKEEDVFVVRNGPLLSKYDLNLIKPIERNNNEILVGYVGNMNLQDGVDEILYAAEIIKKEKKRGDIKFILIGGGANQVNLVKETNQRRLDDLIEFTGRINDKEMLSTLRGCDFCVQPDPYNPLNDVSTMNKVMEYMALEKAFVAYDLKETRVSGGECGLYAENNNREDFVNKILLLANDQDLRIEMGKKGRKRIEEKLEWLYSVTNLLKAYRMN